MKSAPDAHRERRTGTVAAPFAWILAFSLLAGFAWVAWEYFAVEDATLPNLVGLTYSQAVAEASAVGVVVQPYSASVSEAEPGRVVEQSPPAGATVRQGRGVAIGVNERLDVVRMPDLVGLAERDATDMLEGLNLPAADLAYVRSAQSPGRVLRQAPLPGADLLPGERITLEIARVADSFPLEVPNVVGLTLDDARARLATAGFRRVETVVTSVQNTDSGTITVQQPRAGNVQLPGEPITLGYAISATNVVAVPALAGASVEAARAALRRAGLTLGPVALVNQPDAPRGVLEVRPDGYTLIGAPVSLVVNEGGFGSANANLGTDDLLALFEDNEPIRFDGGTSSSPGEAESTVSTDVSGAEDESQSGDQGGDPAEAEQETELPDFLSLLTLDGASVDGTPLDPSEGRIVNFAFEPQRLGVASLLRNDYGLRVVVRENELDRVALEGIVPAGEAVFATVLVRSDDALLQTFVNDIFFQAWHP